MRMIEADKAHKKIRIPIGRKSMLEEIDDNVEKAEEDKWRSRK